MGIIRNWQTQVREYFLQKMMRKLDVRRTPTSFALAKSVGILFDATEPADRDIVEDYSHQIKRKGKKVQLLGFFNNKQDPGAFSFKAFNRSGTDWLERPNTDDTKAFTNQAFDILISVYRKPILPLEYIAALSHAQLRVGPYTDNTYCYDLMIDTSKSANLSKYLKEVDFFLNRMNRNEHETTHV